MVLPAQLVCLELVDHEFFGLGDVFRNAYNLQLKVSTLMHYHIFYRLTFGTLRLNIEVVSGLNLVWQHELELTWDTRLEQLQKEPVRL